MCRKIVIYITLKYFVWIGVCMPYLMHFHHNKEFPVPLLNVLASSFDCILCDLMTQILLGNSPTEYLKLTICLLTSLYICYMRHILSICYTYWLEILSLYFARIKMIIWHSIQRSQFYVYQESYSVRHFYKWKYFMDSPIIQLLYPCCLYCCFYEKMLSVHIQFRFIK